MTSSLALKNIQVDFPILKKNYAYLDNAATTHSPKCVIDSATAYYSSMHSNVHSGVHDLSEKATRIYENARSTVANFINAKSSEVVFCSGTTAAINTIVFGYAKKIIQPGSNIIVSGMEHHANLIPWQILAKDHNITLQVIPVLANGELDLAAYKAMLNENTDFVAITHVSNVLGTINPVADMVAMAKKYGAKVLVDGAQAIAHIDVDVKTLDCDFYAFSAHKIYGPTGIGALYIKTGLLGHVSPFIYGGGMIEAVSYESADIVKDDVMRLEPGTPNISGAVGFACALDYISKIGTEYVVSHEIELLQYATEELNNIPGLRIYGTAENKVGVIAFTLDKIHAHDITSLLNDCNVAVRGGHHCAMPLVKSFGLNSITRVSLGIYNTKSDIDQLIVGINKIRKVFQL